MSNKIVIRPSKAPAPVGPYSQAVRAGDLLFCAGQIPLDPATGALVAGEIGTQTERVMENIRSILDAAGLTFAHVVKVTVFLTNLAEFASMNEVFSRYFQADYPARTTVQVAALPRGAKVEIEVMAHY